MTSFILEGIILKNGGPVLFTVTSIASLSVQEKSSNFHFAYLYFKYNILHRTHYFQSFPLFFPIFSVSHSTPDIHLNDISHL